jgi:AcrR family transcriptional regulator
MTEAQPQPIGPDTRQKLLDAAERLFAEHGVHRASLRAITQDASANLAAVNYHFGSKEALLRAVLSRRLGPLNSKRLALLKEVLETAEGKPAPDEVVRAFVAPVLSMVERESGGHAFARFVARTFSEPDPALRRLVLEEFDQVFKRFIAALELALPELDREEIHWRFLFTVGAMAHTAGFGFLMHQLSDGLCDPHDVDGLIQRLVRFVTGGLTAPVARPSDHETTTAVESREA